VSFASFAGVARLPRLTVGRYHGTMVHSRTTILLAALFALSCGRSAPAPPLSSSRVTVEETYEVFQQILDTEGLEGVILVLDPQRDLLLVSDRARIHQGYLPASTFKIPNSILALEVGVVEGEGAVFPWDGAPRRLSVWDRDMTFAEAFRLSCVPCYQDIARRIGVERMEHGLARLGYPGMVVDSADLDTFWLEGESRITPYQQIDFLRRLYGSELPIQPGTEAILKRIMVVEENPRWTLSGKTGWALRDGHDTGWWVGYVENGGGVYFGATAVEPKEGFDMTRFNQARQQVARAAFRALGIMD
jgi:beta-lactamase class D